MTPEEGRRDGVKSFLRTLARTIPMLWRAAPLETTVLALVLAVQGLVPTLSIYLTQLTIDGVARLLRGEEVALLGLVGLWVLSLAGSQLLAPLNQALQGNVAERFTAHINLELMRKAACLPGLDLLEDPRYYDDLQVLQEGARNRPLNLVVLLVFNLRDAVTILSLALLLATLAWWVPLVVLAAAWPHAAATLRLREIGWQALISRSPDARRMEYDSRIALSHAHAAEARLHHLFPWLQARYRRRFEATHRTMRTTRARQAWGVLPSSVLSVLVAGGLFAWAVTRAGTGAMTLGGLVLVVQALAQMQSLAMSLAEGVGMLHERTLYFTLYFRFLEATPAVQAPTTPAALPAGPQPIVVDDVSFTYPDGRPALHNVSFTLAPGETVALVGENGAGKTTLVKLLLRFYDPSHGRIRIGTEDLRDVDPVAWRARVAAVFQDFGRYAFTLRENVTLGSDEGNHGTTRVHEALEAAGLASLVLALEGGVEAQLGKEFGGTDLSGGQWQKVAMARALCRNPQLLVLDEPTAALDPRSEHELYTQFTRMAKGRTVLLITHRLASVRMADRILVLQDGRLVEEGSHAELLARDGEYAQLWRMQASTYSAEATI